MDKYEVGAMSWQIACVPRNIVVARPNIAQRDTSRKVSITSWIGDCSHGCAAYCALCSRRPIAQDSLKVTGSLEQGGSPGWKGGKDIESRRRRQ